MKKLISAIVMFFLLFNIVSTFAYTIDEGASDIETVINNLEESDYTFKYNAGSSAKASYHVYYKDNMIGYIYATDNGITLGEGWDTNGELGIFFNQKELTIDEIIERFYTDKTSLGESAPDNNIYLCSGNTKDFFSCLSSYTNNNMNSEGKIILFDGDIEKDINISFGTDNIIYKSINSDGITKTCNINNENKLNFIDLLSRWEAGAFSTKDFDFTTCNENKTLVDNGVLLDSSSSDFDLLDLINLDGGSDLGRNSNISDVNDFTKSTLDGISGLISTGIKNFDLGFVDDELFSDNTLINNNEGIDTNYSEITYQDGLDIISDTNIRLEKINENIQDDSLKAKMLLYRSMWNNIKTEDEKGILGKEGLRIKYLHKIIEEKYKVLFREYVLSDKNYINTNIDNNHKTNAIVDNTGVLVNDFDNSKAEISAKLLNNFKNLFYILSDKYNKDGNFSSLSKINMESLFSQVDKENRFNSINDFLSSDSSIIDQSYNIDILQKLMIIMCTQ